MKQSAEIVTRIPAHPVVAAAIVAYDKFREWADGMLVGHTDFNKVFYEVIRLLGEIKAGNAPDKVAKAAEDVVILLCQLAEFFEQAPFKVKSYEELQALGAELVMLRNQLKQVEVKKEESPPIYEVPVTEQNLNPILEAIAGIGSKIDLVLLQRVIPATPVAPTQVEPPTDSKTDDVKQYTETLLKYREWLRSTRDFEMMMRDRLAELHEHQQGRQYGIPGVDKSADVQAVEQLLNSLVDIRKPVEIAVRELEAYIAAWNVIHRGVLEKYRNVELPEMCASTANFVMSVDVKDTTSSPPVQIVPEKNSLTGKKQLAFLGTATESSPAEVLYVTLFDLVPRGKGQARGYHSMARNAFTAGLVQKFGWDSAEALLAEYQQGKKDSYVREALLRKNGVAKNSLILSRTPTPLPWAVTDVFSEVEIEKFKRLIG